MLDHAGVGRRTTNPTLFQRLHQCRFGVAGGSAGLMVFHLRRDQLQRLVIFERRQRSRLFISFFTFISRFFLHFEETVEQQRTPLRPEFHWKRLPLGLARIDDRAGDGVEGGRHL